MTVKNNMIKSRILTAALPDVPFDGWTLDVLETAAQRAGYEVSMVRAVFPQGMEDAISYFSTWLDEQMMDRLAKSDPSHMRVRDRIAFAVKTRLDIMEPYKEAERLALAFWMRPFRKWKGLKLAWKTADLIWDWAGDTATDYNRYTKRGLLSGILTATTLYWLNDSSENHQDTVGFLNRRIENVMGIGKIVGRLKTA